MCVQSKSVQDTVAHGVMLSKFVIKSDAGVNLKL